MSPTTPFGQALLCACLVVSAGAERELVADLLVELNVRLSEERFRAIMNALRLGSYASAFALIDRDIIAYPRLDLRPRTGAPLPPVVEGFLADVDGVSFTEHLAQRVAMVLGPEPLFEAELDEPERDAEPSPDICPSRSRFERVDESGTARGETNGATKAPTLGSG